MSGRASVGTGTLEALTDNYVTVAFDADDRSVGRVVDLTIEEVSERQTFGRMCGV